MPMYIFDNFFYDRDINIKILHFIILKKKSYFLHGYNYSIIIIKRKIIVIIITIYHYNLTIKVLKKIKKIYHNSVSGGFDLNT